MGRRRLVEFVMAAKNRPDGSSPPIGRKPTAGQRRLRIVHHPYYSPKGGLVSEQKGNPIGTRPSAPAQQPEHLQMSASNLNDPVNLTAEVIAIGDELTSGQRLDTNSQWLSQQLGDLGIRVGWHTTVGDDLAANVDVFRIALERADVVISTGGLGPTADDLTREALATAAGVELFLDEPSLERIQYLFSSRGREMPERNRIQAFFPNGSLPIFNPHGTAPGIDLTWPRETKRDSRVFALPGVPSEMRDMWSQTVVESILSMPGVVKRRIIHRCIKCFGVGESEVERRLPDLIRRDRIPRVGITASTATITLRITAEGESEAAARELILPTETIIRETLGEIVYGEEEEELQDVLVRLLREQSVTLAVGEAATSGLLSQWMRQVDPTGSVFRGGKILQPTPDSLPGPPTDALDKLTTSVEDHELVKLARQLRQEYSAHIGLAIGHLAAPALGPDGSALLENEKPAAIEMALVDERGPFLANHVVVGHPDIFMPRAAKQGLDLVRRRLLKAIRESER